MTSLPVISTQADLERVWRHLVEPLGFGGTSLWFLPVGPDGQVHPAVVEVEDVDPLPPPDEVLAMVAGVAATLDHLVPGARVAFLRSRPGRGGVDADDRAWARELYAAARATGVALEVVHLATDADVLPLPADAA